MFGKKQSESLKIDVCAGDIVKPQSILISQVFIEILEGARKKNFSPLNLPEMNIIISDILTFSETLLK